MGSQFNTYDCATTSVTNHKVLTRAKLVEISKVGTVDSGRFGLRDDVQTVTPRAITSKSSCYEFAVDRDYPGAVK